MIFRKLRHVFTPNGSRDNDASDELRFHVEKEVEKNIASGMSPQEARRQALIAFGGIQQTRETLREVHHGRLWESLLQDLRYGWRMLRKSPAFTTIAVLTLALGIGANTAIFSLIDAVLFRSMPIADPQSLVLFQWQAHHGPQTHSYWSGGDCEERMEEGHGCSMPLPFFREVEAQTNLFSHVAAFTAREQLDMSGNGAARMVRGEFVSGDFFATLGVRSHMGRIMAQSDDAPEAPAVAVLNYGFWQTSFGGSPSAIGKTVRLNGIPFTIIGVTEPKFDALTLANSYDLWIPLAHRPSLMPHWRARQDQMDSWWLIVLARVKPGIPVTQAQAAVSLMFRNEMVKGAKPIFKAEYEPGIKLASAARDLGGSQKDTLGPLWVLMLCVGVVLLIACANVAGLLLARSTARQREIAVRLALGAKRGRLILQLLTESLMLSLMGGALGLLLAIWGARLLMVLVSAGSLNPPGFAPQLDWRVLAFTAGVSLFTGIVFGLAPALRGSDVGLTSSLKAGDGGLSGGSDARHRRFTLSGALVAVQMALAIVVLVTAGLLVRTLTNLKSLNPGFDAHSLLLFGVDPRLAGYKGPQIDNLYRDLQDKFSALPGVSSASYSWRPLLSGGLSTMGFRKPGSAADSKDEVDADELPIGPHFFTTWRIPFHSGHDFTLGDYETAAANSGDKPGSVPTPAIVNQAFVRNYFPNVNPLGERFADAESTEPGEPKSPGYQIMGVVGDAKYNSLRRDVKPTFYIPNIGGEAFFQLRTAADPNSMIAAVRSIVSHENEELALFRISTETQAIDRQLASERITAQLSSFFGLLALVLACLGLYGLLSYEVTRRTREIGIRMAIGAQSHNVIRMVLKKGIGLIITGAVVGIAFALGVTRLLASFLFGVKAGDPITMAGVAALLVVVALAACYIPARRATKVDPLVALRYE
ncbi:MAG TPA: ABC transporter permease [Candidatus Angelobacter sp.]|nr:ABC transporter permease [Candidatus Angelobacter sp.]